VINRYFRIVIALDLSQYAEVVLEHALDQAARHDTVDLHFLVVVDNDRDLEQCKEKLATLVMPALDDLRRVSWRARLHVRRGKAWEQIAELAAEVSAHLVVIGRFGVHHRRRRIGAVASRVIDLVTCPTLVVGLLDHELETQEQCPDCVAVREQTQGEQLFCARHASDRTISGLLGPTSVWTGGTLMW
jgi:nucleotide-binding universal stress UspA family protein